MRAPRRGFTLIELLIVVVIIGILAMIAIPKFAQSKGTVNTQVMRADLRNVAIAQDGFYFSNSRYATNLTELDFTPSPGVALTITGDVVGWTAVATHAAGSPTTCALFGGAASPPAPATIEGRVACQ